MEVGSVYRLDHSKLPKFILGQLGHVRAVMVDERRKNKVSVSYPSKRSLDIFFGTDENGGRRKSTWLMQPNLDLVYSMNLNLAETVLCNRISFEEFAARRGTRSFWMSDYLNDEVNSVDGGFGAVKWGLRKRVTFVRKHREHNEKPLLLEIEGVKEEDEKEEMSEEEGVQRRGRKRKHPSKYVKKKKKSKKRGPVEIGMIIKKDNEFDDPASETKLRWTKERYKKAEKSILKVMKAKSAYHGNPIFRADLRAEARKLIGDTGLLDHLLKHMAGKVAPGGKERFRRRHNPAGAMEYWLESADLVSIRMEAGVEDPYWIPPEGWKLGDSPTQDPVCARELKKLKEDLDTMKSDIKVLRSDKQLRYGNISMDVVPAVAALDDADHGQKLLSISLKAMQDDLLKKKAKIEEKLMNVAKALDDIEEDLGGIIVEPKGNRSPEAAAPINEDAGEICSEDREKASRRKRLKSGFRICKPNGTFLWPADVASSTPTFSAHLMIQVEDVLAVSSPSSVGSSKSPFPPPQQQQSTVLRPVAKKPSLGLSVSTVTRGWSGSEVAKASPTASSANNSVFVPDLNEAPLLDGPTTNVNLPCIPYPGFSSSIQSISHLHSYGGMIALRSPRSFQANDKPLVLPTPPAPLLPNTPQVLKNEGPNCS